MAIKVYTIRKNADGTVAVKVGKMVEYVAIDGKTKTQLFDAIKYALISKDAFVSDLRLTQDLYEIITYE